MFDYDTLRDDAREILRDFGKSLTLTRGDAGAAYDPVTGTMTGGASITLTGAGVLLNYNNYELRGETILATDRKLLFVGDPLKIGDAFNGWRVYQINDIDPADSGAVLTIAQLRK